MSTLDDFLDEIEYLKKSKVLLDEILQYYDIYSGQFTPISKIKYSKFHLNNFAISDADELNDKIRKYIKFDDSE